MTYPIWPPELPAQPLAAVQFESWTPPAVTETDHLLPIVRRRSSTDAVAWQVSWRMDNAGASPTQWQLYLAWVRDYVGGGTLPFLWPVWDGLAFANRLAWFGSGAAASVQVAGRVVIPTVTLLVLDPPKISKATLDANATITTGTWP